MTSFHEEKSARRLAGKLEEVDTVLIGFLRNSEKAHGDDQADHATLSFPIAIVSVRRGSINGIDIRARNLRLRDRRLRVVLITRFGWTSSPDISVAYFASAPTGEAGSQSGHVGSFSIRATNARAQVGSDQ